MAIRLTVFRSGATTHWPIQGHPSRRDPTIVRGRIGDMSARARIRAAFHLSNAPKDWGCMATLTFRLQPARPKEALKKFVRAVRAEIGAVQWAWVMEWQTRGVIHFHVFFEADWLERVGYWTETVVRHGNETEIIRGTIDEWIVATWSRCVGDRHADFRRFQAGGIVELLRSPDAAGRYVAKEAGKRVQKRLPDGVDAAGRWWWCSHRPRATRVITLERWPYPKAYSHVFDWQKLLKTRFKETPLTVVTSSGRGRRACGIESHPSHPAHS